MFVYNIIGSPDINPNKIEGYPKPLPLTEDKVSVGQKEEKADVKTAEEIGHEETLKKDPNNVDALLGLARIYLNKGEIDKAENYAKKAYKADPRNPDTNARVGEIFYLTGKHGLAVEHLKRAEYLESKDPNVYCLLAAIYLKHAVAKKSQKLRQEALTYLFKTYELDPENDENLSNIGYFMLMYANKECPLPEYFFWLALTKNPENEKCWNNLSIIINRPVGELKREFKESQDHLEKSRRFRMFGLFIPAATESGKSLKFFDFFPENLIEHAENCSKAYKLTKDIQFLYPAEKSLARSKQILLELFSLHKEVLTLEAKPLAIKTIDLSIKHAKMCIKAYKKSENIEYLDLAEKYLGNSKEMAEKMVFPYEVFSEDEAKPYLSKITELFEEVQILKADEH